MYSGKNKTISKLVGLHNSLLILEGSMSEVLGQISKSGPAVS